MSSVDPYLFVARGPSGVLFQLRTIFILNATIKKNTFLTTLRIMRIRLGILLGLAAAISEVPKGISRQIYCETCHIMAKELIEKLDDLDGKGLGSLLFTTILVNTI